MLPSAWYFGIIFCPVCVRNLFSHRSARGFSIGRASEWMGIPESVTASPISSQFPRWPITTIIPLPCASASFTTWKRLSFA